MDKATAMVFGSFLGDSLALGAHWIYDAPQIATLIPGGRMEALLAPPAGSYHPTKGAGEFTHYGDQTLLLLEHLAEGRGFDLGRFAASWQAYMSGYGGYRDTATKNTLANFAAGLGPDRAGSGSSDLSGAARIAPLVFALGRDMETLVAAVRAQTRMTHNTPKVVDAAEFFARAAVAVLAGQRPLQALEQAGQADYETDVPRLVAQGQASAGQDTVAAIGAFGQSCHVDGALRGVAHCLAKYEDDYAGALQANVMAGGDSAARGLIIGMLLGAHLGETALPPAWLSGLRARERIAGLLAGLKG